MTMRVVAASLSAVVVLLSHGAAAQDLSRYRDLSFGSSVTAVTATTHAGLNAVKVIHQRPALIQELSWRPQYSLARPAAQIEAVQEVVFRFYNDQLSSIAIMYDARLVEGMTNQDIIGAVSSLYGSAVLTAAAARRPAPEPLGTINGSTVLARWLNADYEFTLMREAYPATYRLVGVSKSLDAMARSAATEAVLLDKAEAPQREAARLVAETERRRAADEKTRTTNKGGFRP